MPNSSRSSAAPLHLILEYSPTLQTGLRAIHGLALIAALANPLPWMIKLLLGIVIIVSLGLHRRGLRKIRGLTLTPEHDWEIHFTNRTVLAQLAPSTVVTTWLVILHLTTSQQRIAIPICRDALDPESFRRLRVYLRIGGRQAVLGGDT